LDGDLSKLNPQQRLDYYRKVCESVGLNPLTKPFEYIRLNGQLTLYAKRDAAEQLRSVHGISITDMEETWRDDILVVRAYAKTEDGRTDVATGAVDTSRSKGQDLANDIMKAETKAKRRVTLSLAGLGWLDETEIQDIPDDATEEVQVDYDTGEVVGQDRPDYETRIWQIQKWLDAKPPEKLESALGEVQQKISDWPDKQKRQARAVTLPYAALDQLHKHGPEAEDQLSEWVREKGSELPDEWVQRALSALEEEAEAMRPDQSEKAAEAIMDGETALDSDDEEAPDPNDDLGIGEPPDAEEAAERPAREHDSHEAALEGMCPTALQQGKLNHIPEEERISSEKESPDDTTQLGRLFRIAYQEEDWEESWLDRLIKDELGYESKSHIPKGKAYEEIIEALQSDEMRFWMSRDPDTPDLFEDPAEDEEVPV